MSDLPWWRWALITALVLVAVLPLTAAVWASIPGVLPIIAFTACWWAGDMTWESESLDRWKN